MTDRPHSCRQSPNGRHRFTVSPLMCDYCSRTTTYIQDLGWNAPANDPDAPVVWEDQEADVNDAKPGPSKETLKAFAKEEDERMAALVYARLAVEFPRARD